MKFTILTFAAVIAGICCLNVVSGEEFDVNCDNSPRGFFCTSDLRSVRECHQPGSESSTIDTPCPSGQRCGCGVMRKCGEDETQCVVSKQLPSIPFNFAAQFFGTREVSSPGGFQKFQVTGYVYQNYRNKKLRVTLSLDDQQGDTRVEDSLVVPDNSGGWIEYRPFKSSCSSSALSSFPEYLEKLRKYSISQGDNIWVYRRGPRFPFDSLTKKEWTLKQKRNLFFPKTVTTDDNRGPIAKLTTKEEFTYRLVSVGRIPASYFEVPSQCSNSE